MAMSNKDIVRRSYKKKAVPEELEKQAASGSGDAKKKLAKAKVPTHLLEVVAF